MARISWNFNFSVNATLIPKACKLPKRYLHFLFTTIFAYWRQHLMPNNGFLSVTKWPLVAFPTSILTILITAGLLVSFLTMPWSLMCWWWQGDFFATPSRGKRKKTIKLFNPSWTDGLTFKMAAILNPFTVVIVILWIGRWICLLIFPFSMGKRGELRCMYYCYGKRNQNN